MTAIADLEASLSERERAILTERAYSATPRTQAEVAELLGISRERVTQMERSVRQRLVEVIEATPALAALSATIGRRAAPVADVAALMTDHPDAGAPFGDAGVPCWRVVAAASGLRVTEDWIIRGPLRNVAETTRAIVAEATPGDGIAPVAPIAGRLRLSPDATERWLRRTGFEILRGKASGHAVSATASTGDLFTGALAAAGEPLGFDEIVDATAPLPRAEASIRNVLASDARIVKTDRTRYGLERWNLPRYEPVRVQIGAIVAERGGSAPIEDIIATIRDRYDISPASIRSYAGAGEYQTREGIVTRRERAVRPRRSPGRTRGLYRDGEVVHWATAVTAAQCRGTGFNIPSALAGLLGVGPGSPVTLESPLGPQTFTWASVQARSGSIKRFTDALGLESGTPVFLDFGPGSFDVRRARIGDSRSTAADVLVRLGRRPTRISTNRLLQIAVESLWLPPGSSREDVLELVRLRKEPTLADLLDEALG
ncbi:sigma factor-like helix-turn-helix DNA-binding protein [Gordonia westfalica]|uniref:Sigma-70, region 4 n=1 Tax=Gordonia westfalica TaxID=158898 RepID=A0A1H2KP69_9ACTN|nr:sigma factor-like helix-turn-helix DNA-binding protein [Gordonia westfalica]SDU70402.1 Sigma-70, region 4 [Gordonia westfalica]